MSFSYRTGPPMILQVFLAGVFYLAFVYFGILESPILVTIWAVLPVGVIIAGFAQTFPGKCGVLLPPFSGEQLGMSVDGIPAQPFPQLVAYGVELRNLWLLAAALFVSFLLWAAVAAGLLHRSVDNPLPLYFAIAALVFSTWIAARWLHERVLIRWSCSVLARVHTFTNSRVQYEFFDPQGERRGGCSRVFGPPLRPEWPTPVLIDLRNPNNSKLYAAFWFLRFRVVDARHVSETLLRSNERKQ
jgi:hypothetical protein